MLHAQHSIAHAGSDLSDRPWLLLRYDVQQAQQTNGGM